MKWFLKSGLLVAAIVAAVCIIGNSGCATISEWAHGIDWGGVHTPTNVNFPTNWPPIEVTNTPPASEQGLLSDDEARAIIAGKQFLEGADKNSPIALFQFKRFGNRISHVGGGCKPNDPANETALWKPIGDSSPNLVILLPCHVGTFSAVSVGGERATGMSLGNGWRPTIRFKKPGASYGSNVRLVVEGVGSAIIPNGGTRTTFKLSTSGGDVVETNSAAVVDSDPFRWTPGASSISVRVPKELQAWQAHLFSRRKHAILWGPARGAGPWTIPMSPAQIAAASRAAGDDGTALFYVNCSGASCKPNNSAGWRIMSPENSLEGDGSKLKDGENK